VIFISGGKPFRLHSLDCKRKKKTATGGGREKSVKGEAGDIFLRLLSGWKRVQALILKKIMKGDSSEEVRKPAKKGKAKTEERGKCKG